MSKPITYILKAPSIAANLGVVVLKSQEFENILIALTADSFEIAISELNLLPEFYYFEIKQKEKHLIVIERSTDSIVLISDYRRSIIFTLKKWLGLKVKLTGSIRKNRD